MTRRYRIIFDPNDNTVDAYGKHYRRYTIQKKLWWGWTYLTHYCHDVGGVSSNQAFVSHFGTREECMKRILEEEEDLNRQCKPIQVEEITF